MGLQPIEMRMLGTSHELKSRLVIKSDITNTRNKLCTKGVFMQLTSPHPFHRPELDVGRTKDTGWSSSSPASKHTATKSNHTLIFADKWLWKLPLTTKKTECSLRYEICSTSIQEESEHSPLHPKLIDKVQSSRVSFEDSTPCIPNWITLTKLLTLLEEF